jgi:hypothetical protein
LPALFRRREVWLPTWPGALLLLALAVLVVGLFGFEAYALLALHRPALGNAGAGARTLVVEGWMAPGDLQQAVAVVRAGRYDRVLTTGGPIEAWSADSLWQNYADRSAAYLRANGVTGVPVIAMPASAPARDRTYRSAVVVREWARQSGVRLEAIDLFSLGVHARRSWLVFRMVLGDDVEVGVLAAQPVEYDGRLWWTTSDGAKTTIGEVLSLVWTQCCFWPPALGSHEEHPAVAASPPAKS